ncbi:MAG TPA: [Fe-Fe] hydrogenase large subunit C-terminal domain-containing protein [Bacteroidales bacterium]|nr:[Fe-Fe] hydrogenase large subunit C-terminal domain-containing protein [Bacteroidales bacterium]HPT01819.1 [Fe-Fe] hydrogenase large subunit C-terminal domain-containing protein [Bacteroidales bacterium]
MLQAIYTERNNCQDCYKCIRQCPVKAIKIEDHSASVISSLCLYCGRCVQVCPVNAKKVRNDLNAAKFHLSASSRVVLSLAPSYKSEFTDYTLPQLLEGLYGLGFFKVSETALGAELVSKATKKWLDEQPDGIYYSSCCPSIVRLLQKYYPEQLRRLAPVDSPMQAHARFIRKMYGEHTCVIFAGPCIAKKKEIEDYQGGADLAITFAELREWLKGEGLTPDFLSGSGGYSFAPYNANNGSIYPVDGGMISTMKQNVGIADISFMSFSGLQNVKGIIEQLPEKYEGKLFIELMVCEGGCINGPVVSHPGSTVGKRVLTLKQPLNNGVGIRDVEDKGMDLFADYSGTKPVTRCVHTEKEIQDALKTVGKVTDKDELNCGGCGYESCRRFAEAMLDGKAERNMCVSYMRKVAQNKATVLLQKMPYGVVLVDDKLKIIESNQYFARMLGEEAMNIYSVKPGMEGADLRKLTPQYKLFANFLEKGLDEFNKDIRMDDGLYHLSIFSIQQFRIVCGIIHKLDQQHFSKNALTERLHKVISENLATAQKAAFILGENASRTETMLHNIIDSYQSDEDGNG